VVEIIISFPYVDQLFINFFGAVSLGRSWGQPRSTKSRVNSLTLLYPCIRLPYSHIGYKMPAYDIFALGACSMET